MGKPFRALLVEFINADQFPGRIDQEMPLLRGWLDKIGAPTRWIRFGMSTTHLMEHDRDQMTLSDGELEVLLAAADEHRPDLIVLTDPLFEPQIERLRARTPRPKVYVKRDKPLQDRREFGRYGGASELSRGGPLPRYDWEAGNEAATRHEIDNIYLMLAGSCGHRRRVADNPRFCELDDERVAFQRGCSFCHNWLYEDGNERIRKKLAKSRWRRVLARVPGFRPHLPPSHGKTPDEWVRRQIEGIAESRGAVGRLPHGLLMERLESPRILGQCLDALADTGMAEHVKLLMAVRPAHVPVLARHVRRYFARYPDSAFRLGVYASGIESFCDHDLVLFNKGIRPLDGLRAVNTYRTLAREFPGRFSYTGLSLILLTPWTTPETLRLNVGLIRFLDLDRKEAGNMFQARLRLHPRLALTALAERDGLLVEEESDPSMIMNRRKLFRGELPWRFADPRMRPLARIVMRFDLLGGELADELARAVHRSMRKAHPEWRSDEDRNLVEFLLCLIDVVRSEPAPLDEAALLERGQQSWADKRAEAAGPAPPRRFRIDAERLDLRQLLDRTLVLVADGHKGVLSVDNVNAAELARVTGLIESAGLVFALVDAAGGAATSEGTLVIARDGEALRRRLELWTATEAAAVREVGLLHGVPECCAEAYAQGPFCDVALTAWAALSKRNETAGPVPPEIRPLTAPSIAFVACTPDCPEAAERYSAWFRAVGIEPTEPEAAWADLVDLAGKGDGPLVSLRVIDATDESLCYDASALRGDSGRLAEALRAGDRLELLPGQTRVLHGGELVDVFGPSVVVWSADRSWNPDETRELATAAAHRARTGSLSDARADPEGSWDA